jgi:hypothetical protein
MDSNSALVATQTILNETSYSASFVNGKIVIFGLVEMGTMAQLFTINGQKVGEYWLEPSDRNEIAASGLNQSTYLLKISGKNCSRVLKLIGTKY